jgi:hypothetical protein
MRLTVKLVESNFSPMNIDFILQIIKALVEVALLSIVGQGIVGLMAGAARNNNFVFVLFGIIASPATKTVRAIVPKHVVDRYIPHITFAILSLLWLGIFVSRIYLRIQLGSA